MDLNKQSSISNFLSHVIFTFTYPLTAGIVGAPQMTSQPLLFLFYNFIVPMEFLPWEIQVAFPGESQLQQSRATQSTVHAGCLSVSIIHRTLTWTTGSLTCAQMLMSAIAQGVHGHM